MNQADLRKQRKLQRRHLIYYLRVFNRNTGALIGHLVDLTREGLMLISEGPQAAETGLPLRMALPEEIFGRAQLDFEARCMWSRRDINPSFFVSGYKISQIAPHDMESLEGLITEYGFRD